jgi:primosomal protein N' (replication factor Y)
VVVVQTENPASAPVALASEHKYEEFARLEIAARAHHGLPPVTRMARVVCLDENNEKACAHAADVAKALRAIELPDVRVEGPMECVVSRVSGRWRWSVEITAPGAGTLRETLARAREAIMHDGRAQVDVDPVALL